MVWCKVSRNMDACPRYLCTCVYVIVCMSARKKAPVNLLMCPFELYMFIGVSMQLRVVFKYDFLVLIPYCWSVALEKKKKKKKKNRVIFAREHYWAKIWCHKPSLVRKHRYSGWTRKLVTRHAQWVGVQLILRVQLEINCTWTNGSECTSVD